MSHNKNVFDDLIKQEIKKANVSSFMWGEIEKRLGEISESLNRLLPGEPLVELKMDRNLSIAEMTASNILAGAEFKYGQRTIEIESKNKREREVYLTAGSKNIKVCEISMSETASEFRVEFNKRKIRFQSVEDGFMNFAKELLMADGLIASVIDIKRNSDK